MIVRSMKKRYSELIMLSSYDERLNYLRTTRPVGIASFGADRYFNQQFYRSFEWRELRHRIIVRDNGCDLAISELPIFDANRVVIHHINPITIEQVQDHDSIIFDPENLICCSHQTHNAIHYQLTNPIGSGYSERTPYDTCPWKVGV